MYQQCTDEELQQLLVKGDLNAFDEIYRRYWEPLSRYAYNLTASPAEVCDIVQDVFVSLWKRRNEFVPCGPLRPYLYKCVRNLSLRYLQKNMHQERYLQSLNAIAQRIDADAMQAVETRDLEIKINGAVEKLPEKMRDVFLLSRRQHLSYREIAEQLGIAETTVKKQVNNALRFLKNEVRELDVLIFCGLITGATHFFF